MPDVHPRSPSATLSSDTIRINELLVFSLLSNDTHADTEVYSGSPIIIHDIPTTARSNDLTTSVHLQIPPKV